MLSDTIALLGSDDKAPIRLTETCRWPLSFTPAPFRTGNQPQSFLNPRNQFFKFLVLFAVKFFSVVIDEE